jgi:hypothetical protein
MAGAATVVILCEALGWYLSMWLPALLRPVSMAMLVALPVAGVALSFGKVRRGLRTVWSRALSAGAPGRLLQRALAQRCYVLGACIAAFVLVAWHGGLMCWHDMAQSVTSGHAGLSAWMVALWIPFLGFALALRTLLVLLRGRRAGQTR